MPDRYSHSSGGIVFSRMRNLASQHEGTRPGVSNRLRILHVRRYFGLQLIRRRLSRFPPGMITLIPASRWLFENYHKLYLSLKSFQAKGGAGCFRGLPLILSGPGKGFPRIYMIAREILLSTNMHVSEDAVIDLINEYQKIRVLTTAELDLLPDALTLSLLDMVIEQSNRILPAIECKIRANDIMDKAALHFIRDESEGFRFLSERIRKKDARNHTYSSHLIYRLNALAIGKNDIEEFLRETLGENQGDGMELVPDITEKERLFESDSESIISALIESLSEVSDLDIDRYFSSVSTLESMLGKDPSGIYSAMDAPTRGLYRRKAVRFARRYGVDESFVAEAVLKICRYPPKDGHFSSENHVGTYLLGEGRPYLCAHLSGKRVVRRMPADIFKSLARVAYFLIMLSLTMAVIPAVCVFCAIRLEAFSYREILFVLSMIVPATGIGVFAVNTVYTRLIEPQPCCSMDFEKGVPESCSTFVVMPVIISSVSGAKSMTESMERHYLANRSDHLYFALLVDFRDAPAQKMPEDDAILEVARREVERLNRKHTDHRDRFFLFYREREWNPKQKCWMGWERKRGKLEGFNSLLCAEEEKRYRMPVGDASVFPLIKYVITLDGDTEIPQESAKKMIGVIEHPLNQPVLDADARTLKSGYVIVQSEIGNRIPAPSAGLFQVMLSGQAGFDPYSTIVSDVYQDTFHEGIYAGKGIYHLRAFHALLKKKIPENSVLSHDLLEGSLTRCAFASGIKLLERVPSRIGAYIKREHRWIRGDWQLLPFLIRAERLNLLSRWKMLDNLRRSVMHPALLILILCNLFLVPGTPWIWMIFLFFEPAVNIIRVFLYTFFRKTRRVFERISVSILGQNIFDVMIQSVYRFILVPVRAVSALDAIVRTLYRLLVSHRNLLEWQTADSVERDARSSFGAYLRLMLPSVMMSAAFFHAAALPVSVGLKAAFAIFCSLFALSPVIALLSEKQIPRETRLFPNKEQIAQIRRIAVRIKRYFADHSREETHYLCPDHFQEIPGPKTADRTSPTNIGLQLLASLSARDLGYSGLLSFVDSADKVIEVIRKLPKWNGHLHNWYDTVTLDPIEPSYVSTVDSGNFLAHLITVKEGLMELKELPIFRPPLIQGLSDLLLADEEEIIDDISSRKRIRPRKPVYAKAPRKQSVMASLLRYETEDSVPEERLGVFFMFAETLLVDPKTWSQTTRFCEELIRDRDKLARDQLSDLLFSPAELAEKGNRNANILIRRMDKLIGEIDRIIAAADFRPLFDNRKRLFYIGYHVSLQKPDRGHYDLMASESRLASFLAISKGDVPKRHWVRLGRPLTLVRGMPALVSWSGSMFEYLMPNLVLRTPPGTIMDYSCRAAVVSQIRYGRKHHIPWGISESQYYIFDNHANYQYGPFGVSRMRLQPSLKPVKVVAPYATILALGIQPRKALANIRKLIREGAGAKYGLYEALDYGSPDPNTMSEHATVRSFMTHHLGMSIAAINNLLNENILQTRFHREPMIRANEILLEERFTSPMVTIASIGYTIDVESEQAAREEMQSRILHTTHPEYPTAHVLCNGHYQVMITSEGNGFSAYDHMRINRFRSDRRYGGSGTFVYIREPATGRLFSATYAPVQIKPDSYQVIFSHDKAEFRRKDGMISTQTEVTISPVDPIEIRRITLTNHGNSPVYLELTSYLEVVADDAAADASHPAYSKLFIESQFLQERSLLIARRRPKSEKDRVGYVMHLVRTDMDRFAPIRFETSRQDFIGRGGSTACPEALMPGNTLPGRGGVSTDPILSLQIGVTIGPGRSVSVSFMTGYCPSMNALLNLCDKLAIRMSDEDIFRMARTSSLLEIEYFKIRSVQLNAIQNLVGAIYYPTNVFRGGTDELADNSLGQSGLWRFGISGDRPILLLRVSEPEDRSTVKEVLLAYEFLRLQKVSTDLIIYNEAEGGYDDSLQQMIFEETAQVRVFEHSLNRLGIFIIRACRIEEAERTLLLSAARIIFTPQTGIYFRKIVPGGKESTNGDVIHLPSGNFPTAGGNGFCGHTGEAVPEFFNGIGGFVRNGREYEIRLSHGAKTPAPWLNVITNGRFGFQISEIGSGYTWSKNSRENKLTVWSNDPVTDPPSEVLYVRNKKTGLICSPCALIPGADGYFRVRHGFGYSVFQRESRDCDLELMLFCSADAPVKLMILNIINKTNQSAKFNVAFYAEWVLGVFRETTERFIVTEYNGKSEILTARNTYCTEESKGVTYLFCDHPVTYKTGDRQTFFGRNGNILYPEALVTPAPSQLGAGLDPCGVIACDAKTAPHGRTCVVFGLGHAENSERAEITASHFRTPGHAQAELKTVQKFWEKLPGNISIRTPNRAMDILMNGWLLYQVIACRLMARAAFYQCGGAYGFRDQLQDVLAIMDYDAEMTRRHILLCCSRQFREGDVQHWWHHPDGMGVRTKISDDLLFLPYAVAEYIRHTGDAGILCEKVSFIESEPLGPEQSESVSTPVISKKTGDVYDHCVLAIERACAFGRHGLPLIGGGDWNDGMNAVGKEGLGESVWLGWFLYHVMDLFIPVCIGRGDQAKTERFRRHMSEIKNALERYAWDGRWYLRAYYDNGRPMGSSHNEECMIDSISQAWAVISKGSDRKRGETALRSAQNLLISRGEGIVRLLTPPFDRGENNPGYISGYNPGIRENGGQYTHAAVWMAIAFCEIGDMEEAYRILNMLNPIHATADFRLLNRYQNEPYAMTADVSDGYPNVGRGGWSWYTGAAGWMYRAILNPFLGLKREGEYLVFSPKKAIPFDRYQIEYRFGSTIYEIAFEKRTDFDEAVTIYFEGKKQKSHLLKLVDDASVHHVEVRF
ncbi:MAG: hypothetical protein GXY43_01650 [Clostridiaceae bacterium]|nr:hypothetical protein [Clostridiaceae bacterium]